MLGSHNMRKRVRSRSGESLLALITNDPVVVGLHGSAPVR
eukprot:SAG25_NODE_6570_length_549_cov_0.822222_1_plen_39_part_10